MRIFEGWWWFDLMIECILKKEIDEKAHFFILDHVTHSKLELEEFQPLLNFNCLKLEKSLKNLI